MGKRQGYETVFEDNDMAVLHVAGRDDEAIVAFTGVGHQLGGIDLQTPEFARSDGDETKFFVIDKQRSWGNNIDWSVLSQLVRDKVPNARLMTLGNSMGGFLAILAVPLMGAQKAIAFAPQWSVDPAVVPNEERWKEYRSEIAVFQHSDLSAAAEQPAWAHVFFGNGDKDRVHLEHFKAAGFSPVVLREGGHNVAKYLKETDLLYPVINACRNGEDPRHLLSSAGAPLVSP